MYSVEHGVYNFLLHYLALIMRLLVDTERYCLLYQTEHLKICLSEQKFVLFLYVTFQLNLKND